MDSFLIAWNAWLQFSLLGAIFSIATWKNIPFVSGIYVIGGFIMVLTRFANPVDFGVSEVEWGSEFWRQVRIYIVGGQIGLIGFVVTVENLLSEHWKKQALSSSRSISSDASIDNLGVGTIESEIRNAVVENTDRTKLAQTSSDINTSTGCPPCHERILSHSVDEISDFLDSLGYSIERLEGKYTIRFPGGGASYAYSDNELQMIVKNIASSYSINIIWD